MKANKFIDHTILKADAVEQDIIRLCTEAKNYGFYSVCVNSCWVPLAVKELKGTSVKVCSVVGFPLGAMSYAAKVFEAKNAVEQGADEIDMVINIGLLKDKKYSETENEIRAVKQAIGDRVLKVIIETCYLTDEEKRKVCQLAVSARGGFFIVAQCSGQPRIFARILPKTLHPGYIQPIGHHRQAGVVVFRSIFSTQRSWRFAY